MTPAEELRAAATKLREHAKGLSGGWRMHDTHLDRGGHTATVLQGEGNDTELVAWLPSLSHEPWDNTRKVWQKARWMALVHPGLAKPLAETLEHIADDVSDYNATEQEIAPGSLLLRDEFGAWHHDWTSALASARVINGSATP